MLHICKASCNMVAMQPSNTLEVTISDVSITNVGFAIFLKPKQEAKPSTRIVPIFIGPLETYSISSTLDGITPPRPNTHDLITNMLQEMEARVLHVIINDIVGSIFYARITIQSEDGIIELDARPSDSIAIAIRSKCPIYMHEKVYREASMIVSSESDDGDRGDNDRSEDTSFAAGASGPQNELEKLNRELQKAVDSENFERAAVLRDKIKKITNEN